MFWICKRKFTKEKTKVVLQATGKDSSIEKEKKIKVSKLKMKDAVVRFLKYWCRYTKSSHTSCCREKGELARRHNWALQHYLTSEEVCHILKNLSSVHITRCSFIKSLDNARKSLKHIVYECMPRLRYLYIDYCVRSSIFFLPRR